MTADSLKLYGRTMITIAKEIDDSNIVDIVDECYKTHQANVTVIDYLYDYYRGLQDVYYRTKTVNTYILENVTENRAKEIVDFKTGYSFGKDIVYSAMNGVIDKLTDLNAYMRLEGRQDVDYSVGEWQNICGTGYKIILPKEDFIDGDAPFTIDSVDPRDCFVIYSSGLRKSPKACVYLTEDENENTVYSVYAKTAKGIKFYRWVDGEAFTKEDWTLSMLPIIEYPLNNARLGAFEPVIPLLNAINVLDSNRVEGIAQFIEALLVLINCKLPDGWTAATVKEHGLIELASDGSTGGASIQNLCSQLDQQSTQSLKDDFYDAVLTICSMPNRNGGSSTSDTGLAVIYRDGWSAAATIAQITQNKFRKSEYDALRLILEICEETNVLSIPLKDIAIDFTAEHYENLATKVESFLALLNNDKVDPHTAYRVCGIFTDPDLECEKGLKWYEEVNGTSTETSTKTYLEIDEQTDDREAETVTV